MAQKRKNHKWKKNKNISYMEERNENKKFFALSKIYKKKIKINIEVKQRKTM